jgi:hypothetical protein
MSAIIVLSVLVVAYFFFPTSSVKVVKEFSGKRASQWKEVLKIRATDKDGNPLN